MLLSLDNIFLKHIFCSNRTLMDLKQNLVVYCAPQKVYGAPQKTFYKWLPVINVHDAKSYETFFLKTQLSKLYTRKLCNWPPQNRVIICFLINFSGNVVPAKIYAENYNLFIKNASKKESSFRTSTDCEEKNYVKITCNFVIIVLLNSLFPV